MKQWSQMVRLVTVDLFLLPFAWVVVVLSKQDCAEIALVLVMKSCPSEMVEAIDVISSESIIKQSKHVRISREEGDGEDGDAGI